MRLMDRVIATKSFRYYAFLMAIATGLLVLENAPRVLNAATRLSNPLPASLLVMVGLLPEYLALAGIFGIYFAGALLAFRSQRRNELVAWSAIGIPTWRLTAAFSALALGNAAMILVMLGWLQPRGEVMVAMVDRDIAAGLYGLALERGEPAQIGNGGTMMFETIDPRTGHLKGVFIRLPSRTISARDARLTPAERNAIRLDFTDGVSIESDSSGKLHSVRFDKLTTIVADPHASPAVDTEPFQKLASLSSLLEVAADRNLAPLIRQTALAELVHRLLLPLLSLAFAPLGFLLGIPGRTSGSLAAVMCGTGGIVIFLRLANLGRGPLVGIAVPWSALLMAIAIGLCWEVSRLNRRYEPGFIDKALAGWLRKVRRRFGLRGDMV